MTKKVTYSIPKSKNWGKVKEEALLFSDDAFFPNSFPTKKDLHPSPNLLPIFDECHNYIYANEGLLKDKVFHEIVKLLLMKLCDENRTNGSVLRFCITRDEYRSIIAGRASVFDERMEALYDYVRREFPDYVRDDAVKLSRATLAFIVNRLQLTSLTATAGDVKGTAFQTFVYNNQRGDRGEYFTPHPIVKLAVMIVAPRTGEKVIDPACGSGGFLIETIRATTSGLSEPDVRSYVRNCIRGIEFNPDVATSAMLRMAFEGGTGKEVLCANTLTVEKDMDNSFDVVLTNPPFGTKGKVEDRSVLKNFLLARRWIGDNGGGWSHTNAVLPGQTPEILFLEKCIKLLRPGGRIAIVVPDGILQNVSNEHVRYWIRSNARVLAVISLPQETFIPYGTGIKTSLLILQKLPSNNEKVFMGILRKVGYDVKGQPVYQKDKSGEICRGAGGKPVVADDIADFAEAYQEHFKGKEPRAPRTFSLRYDRLNSRLDAEHYDPSDREMLEELRRTDAKPLGDIADIVRESDNFRLCQSSEIRYIAISDVDSRTMQVVSQQEISAHEAPSRATYGLRKGNIITAISGASTGTSRQATALITEDEDGAICSNGFAVIRNVHGVEPLYLLAFMRTGLFHRQVRRLMTGHAIPTIAIDELSQVLVPVPERNTQIRIADSFKKLHDMIRKSKKEADRIIQDVEMEISNGKSRK